MPNVVVRYRTKPERAEENQRLVEEVFADLREQGASGFSYTCLRLEDGVSFVHVVIDDDEGPGHNLTEIPAFQRFVADIADRCDEPPVAVRATVVGAHRRS